MLMPLSASCTAQRDKLSIPQRLDQNGRNRVVLLLSFGFKRRIAEAAIVTYCIHRPTWTATITDRFIAYSAAHFADCIAAFSIDCITAYSDASCRRFA